MKHYFKSWNVVVKDLIFNLIFENKNFVFKKLNNVRKIQRIYSYGASRKSVLTEAHIAL